MRQAVDSRSRGDDPSGVKQHRRREAALGDELRHRRIQVMLHAAGGLADLLREDARQAQARFPLVDTSGTRLPPEPPSDDPYAVALWWDDLDEPDRHLVTRRLGNWCGRADGLPADVRHQANITHLAEEIHTRAGNITEEIAAADSDEAPQDPRGDVTHGEGALDPRDTDERANADLRGLLKLRALFSLPDAEPGTDLGIPESVMSAESFAALDDVTTPLDRRGLYLLDARRSPLKTAVVLGDLARAHTVILHVPGTTTTVDLRLYREATWMSNLRDEAGRILGQDVGGSEGIAVVDWIGYQAPFDVASRRALGESGLRWLVPGEAVDDRYAREAAPSLARFARGLRASVGPQVRLVASGHSYGASVLGLALRETSVFDAFIVAGCPGIFTDDIKTLKVPPGETFAAVGTGDVVARLGIFGPDAARLPGVQLVAPVPHLATYPDGSRAWTKLNMGHESYYDRGTSLLHDIAAAAVGRQVPHRWPAWAT
ncbi:MAG: alpha/beta hydrolase [Dermatophilaceae bacterium]